MFSEDDLLPLSGIQHILFCARQCALIHVEHQWEENFLTAQGRILHHRVDEQERESRGGLRIVRGLEIRSLRLGLVGIADVVEFRRAVGPAREEEDALIKLQDAAGKWKPFPVEHKRGKPKPGLCDEAQLCAQAICLEEMMHVQIKQGALFYHSIRRRVDVIFGDTLRSVCEQTAMQFRKLMVSQITPPAVDDPRCKRCSLIGLCAPRVSSGNKSVSRFITAQTNF